MVMNTMRKYSRARERILACALLGAACSFTNRALAAVPEASEAPADQSELERPRAIAKRSFRVDKQRSLSISLGPYAGLGLHETAHGSVAHLFAGGIGRLRINFVELGATLEVSDRVQESWRTIGGFVGGYVPFENWVDLEFAVGAGVRHYRNPDPRYGPDGYEAKVPVLTMRAGFSDRLGAKVFGLRLGGELLLGIDLKREKASWSYSYTTDNDPTTSVTGVTTIGGTSIGIAVSAVLDVAPRGSS